MLSSFHQLELFRGIYAGCRATVVRAAAQAHFSEHQSFSILHNQVNLTKATMVILVEQLETLLLQKPGSLLFRQCSPGDHCLGAEIAETPLAAAAFAASSSAFFRAMSSGVSPRPCQKRAGMD